MADRARIRELNDDFRKGMSEGRIMVTQGISQRSDIREIIQQVRRYNRFDRNNDPYCEHDFGTIEIGGQCIFWKIDYYNSDMSSGSDDPSSSAKTTRVMTIMLASEY